MYRSSLPALDNHHRPHTQRSHICQESCFRLLTPLTLWICVSVILRYGYYGNLQMVLGPNSSRSFKTSSVLIKQIVVRDYAKNGVFVYGFSEKPELSLTHNWTSSNYIIIASYSRKGFSLWLNKGSAIRIRWVAQISSLGQLDVYLTKGKQNSGTVIPASSSSQYVQNLGEPLDGREAEYIIKEDNKYRIGITNSNSKSVMMMIDLNVSSRIYDTSKAKSNCSTLVDGSCQLNLLFPHTHFVTVTTPKYGGLQEWYLEFSFVARVATYIAILGLIAVTILIILRYLGVCDMDTYDQDQPATIRQAAETDPLRPQNLFHSSYGTGEQDDDDRASSTSSEDLYDGKICVICYEEPRNCFFVPCGHCATCFDCAQRIMNGETKVCPICRRPVHKVRKLLIP